MLVCIISFFMYMNSILDFVLLVLNVFNKIFSISFESNNTVIIHNLVHDQNSDSATR